MLIVANWKAYVGEFEKAKRLFAASKRLSKNTKNTIVLAPPAPLLGTLAVGNRSRVSFAAQDISTATGGARTGEVTAAAYAAAGASYAIIGHSECRAEGDTETIIAEKLSHAIAQGLTPLLCVGEVARDNEGLYLKSIREEITSALKTLAPKDRSGIITVYEPLWAISKNSESAISSSGLAEMVLYIRKVIAELSPGKNAKHASVLYGGSVEPENIRGLAGGSGVDGFIVGHASTDPTTFSALVKQLF